MPGSPFCGLFDCKCIIKQYVMKKRYLSPAVREADVKFEFNFLDSLVDIGGSTGEDLILNDEVINPWS